MRNLPKGWVHACLPELISHNGIFVDGDWVESKDQDQGGGVRLIQLADVGDGRYVDKSNRFLTQSRAIELGCTFLQRGDVLVARMPDPLGRACIFPGDRKHAVTVVDVCVIRGKQEHFDRSWLMHFINSASFRADVHSLQSGSTRKRISRGNLSTLKLPVPPRSEQARIVEKLEELLTGLDAGVAELKAAQKKLAQYRQSLLKAAVEGTLTAEWRAKNTPTETGVQLLQRILSERRVRWEAKQLAKFKDQGKVPPKDWQKKYPEPVQSDTTDLPELPQGWVWASVDCLLADIETGKSFKCDERPPAHDEIGVVKVSAVSWGEYDEQESKTCTDESRVNIDLLVKTGDFLFSRANTVELVGACVIAKSVNLNVMLSDKILRLVFLDDEIKPWLLYLLRSKLGRKQIEFLATGNQESMKNIGQERIRSIAIPIAPKNEMSEAMALVEQASDSANQQTLANDRLLKQSAAQRQNILKSAFSGQLVPQDPSDEPASELLARIRAERAAQQAVKKPRGRKVKEAA